MVLVANEEEGEGCTRMTEVTQLDAIREKAHKLCREYLRGAWRKIAPYEIIVKKISGGLSNLLYYCSLPPGQLPYQGEPGRILLRLYGQNQGDQALQGIIAESVIFTLLSESQRGPRLFGVFPGGRLEEYIPARPLETDELSEPTLSKAIAEKIAQIHLMEVPINKEPIWLWDTMERWLHQIEEYVKEIKQKDEAIPMVETILTYQLRKELDWLKRYLIEINSPVLFCHNDVQEGNILLKKQGKQNEHSGRHLVLIDFEYCSYNYRAFDIANHLCEWVYDYSNEKHPYFWARQENCPSLDQQHAFIRQYLESIAAGRSEEERTVEEYEVKELTNEVKAFTLASHFFWGLWSVVNASRTKIHFDYWEYGKERFQRYFQRKADLSQSEVKIETTSQ